MSLENYFKTLIAQVEKSDIQNNGKDKNGFFLPTRSVLLQHLNLLKDLHGKSLAKARVQSSWTFVVEHLPSEWLILSPEEKEELKKIIS